MSASLATITITFNNPRELESTLHSTSGLGSEVFVVNGGDDPQALEVISRFPGVRAINEKDRGISDAFNKGILATNRPYVHILNSGDRLTDHSYYADAVQILNSDPNIDFVHAKLTFCHPDGSTDVRGRNRRLGGHIPFTHPTVIVRRSVFDKVGLFSLSYKNAMDFEWACRLERAGIRGLFLDRIVVEMAGGGISSSRERESIAECERALREHGLYQGFAKRSHLFRCFKFFLKSHLP